MDRSLLVLPGTAATIGFVHTVLGPDHYLPFIVLSKARGWTPRKTVLVTALCGVGHVLSSVILGLIGIVVGVALFKLEIIESVRGDIAAWLLMAFGFAYFVWGVHRAVRNRSHEHSHAHEAGIVHSHFHGHTGEHSHVHDAKSRSVTPWILFLIFIFGPCEPLIPILMFPAAPSYSLGYDSIRQARHAPERARSSGRGGRCRRHSVQGHDHARRAYRHAASPEARERPSRSTPDSAPLWSR